MLCVGVFMLFRPVDEMSLRHLFSSDLGRQMLRMSYVGPVLDLNGKIDPSPDALILDMRSSPHRLLRCEFKFCPASKDEFSHNGQFDLGVIWSLPPGLPKDRLLSELLVQNGCSELIVLDQLKQFNNLAEYNPDSLKTASGIDQLMQHIKKRPVPSLYALYLAAELYPRRFDLDRLVEHLLQRFPEVKAMKPQGRGNLIGAFVQSKPPYIHLVHGRAYEWIGVNDSKVASNILRDFLGGTIKLSLPSKQEIDELAV
jgi:hypothetical protein